MPMYYFNLSDNDTLPDVDGTDLDDIDAARDHAVHVAKELMMHSGGILHRRWSEWTMSVKDEKGDEVFSFPLTETGVKGA